jgi:glycosyl hydrolase family 8
MTRTRPTLVAPAVFAALVLVAAIGFALARSGSSSPDAAGSGAARASATRFLQRYVDRDGRVVRRDQGGDTVSEGQGYGLLLAVATGDRSRFASIWNWTRRHLELKNGLFAWRWHDGKVADPQPAADADADIARALALAAWRFSDNVYRRAAARTAGALLATETARTSGIQRVLVAGPWARAQRDVDPSYFSPAGEAVLARSTGDARFQAMSSAERGALTQLTAGGAQLPPDWATIAADGRLRAAGPPNTAGAPQYGLDAVRSPLRLAESCDRRDRALAAKWWQLLRRGDPGAQPRGLDGSARGGASAASLAGAAGAAAAAGDKRQAVALLARADGLAQKSPTYYGVAWAALGRLMLTTHALGGCPPLG